ncbi:BvgS-like domain-containing two-component system sensor histidine kinase [Aliarcobacter faecis]|uniref:transporter substrate-binding domain-containing protein n=1 Tax=Aliarcobacter faecis TaxID=1564138 RepID=UPI0004AEB231|nr:transporter substrate-binding domain-containing protein [Aliarcobacter faecis]QKF73070.1 BvgS-like domain-containing two-component system sensor histidine kinase [Aliarcobacter faecis]
MKIIYLCICLLFVYLFFTPLQNIILNEKEISYLETKKIITMCIDPNWEPFEKINKDGIHEGISADLIKLIKNKLPIDIELIHTKTWDESIQFSKEKKCDILSFLNKTSTRNEWLIFTKPIFTDPNVLVGRNDKSYIEDISKVNLSIALQTQTAMIEKFSKDFPNLTIIPTQTEDEAFKLVEEYKADLTLRSMIVTAYTIKKNGLYNLKIIGEPKGYENNLRIGIRNDEPILRDILDKAILTITQKDIDNIVNKYITIVVEKKTTFTIALWILVVLIFIIFIILLWNYLLNKKVKIELKKNKEQQLKLIEQKRKAQIGELLGNISHQWKNGLTQISSLNLEMILMYKLNQNLNNNKEFYQRLEDTENAIKFMVETMDTFLQYYKEEKKYITFRIKENIEQVMRLIDIEIKNSNLKIDIINNFDLKISANSNEWMHIWLNLITNTIKASKTHNIIPKVKIVINENNIIYADNCKGLEEKILKKIKNGTQDGLGLRMTKKILEKNNLLFNIENFNNGIKIIFYQGVI